MAEDWLQHTGPLNIISSRNLTPPRESLCYNTMQKHNLLDGSLSAKDDVSDIGQDGPLSMVDCPMLQT